MSEDKYKFPPDPASPKSKDFSSLGSVPDPARHWQNRRRMAWLSLWGAVLYPVLVLFTDSESLAAISPHYYLFAPIVTGKQKMRNL